MGWIGVLCISMTVGAASPKAHPTGFNQDMRKLWEDHITWTRLYIVNALNDLPSKESTADRLLRNQAEIGDAFKPFYGNEAGQKLTSLLRDHVLIAAEVIDAAKAEDPAKQKNASDRWYKNSDDIAVFLGGLNPRNWPPADMRAMLREHLDTTSEEVSDGLNKDWVSDIQAYDRLHGQILKMADVLSAGVIKQFPEKFEK